MDPLSAAERSALMGRVRSADTAPELAVRRLAHALGFRFRLQRRDLPGTPDLTFPRLRAVVFVHGCFWHRHACRRGRAEPATRPAFWRRKFAANIARDRRVVRALRRMGWRVLIVWECETSRARHAGLRSRLRRFLTGS